MNSTMAHSFVIDGYDTNGLVHINYGWNGETNGYFAVTNTGYDEVVNIICGIQKDCGSPYEATAVTAGDFMWVESEGKDCVSCGIAICPVLHDAVVPMEFAFVFENKSTKEKTYTIQFSSSITKDKVIDGKFPIEIPSALTDGEYIVYPAFNTNGGEWQRIFYPSSNQGEIDMKIEGGNATYTNANAIEYVYGDCVLYNGMYYTLHNNYREASLTGYKDDNSAYTGDVTIPSVIYTGSRTFPVTKIGYRAFESQKINSIVIPRSVKTIDSFAFSNTTINEFSFEDGSELTSFGSFPFSDIKGKAFRNVVIPYGVKSMKQVFARTGTETIDIPSSVDYLDYGVVVGCPLKKIIVHWEEPVQTYNTPFVDNKVSTTLYVPRGTKQNYEKIKDSWNIADIVEYDDATAISTATCIAARTTGIYTIAGQQTSSIQKGLNIVIDKDGKARKISLWQK